ncbi:MAG: acyl-CoA dehydrogenase family protein [Solirubrobacterales bacterium]|nr:acyl-CoA dehydrogenase family protein [Solirubrobacterales bacterium]MBV9714026.1 acyl-CoA dehydrogenase family protein [Solirubrobacterales bacterium]
MSAVDERERIERVGDELVERARALRSQLIREQAETEERAYYSESVHRALLDAGFYRMYVPQRYGGLEVDVPTFMRVGVELARGDMGAAWGACLSANHALQVGSWFPERLQDEVFGNGDFRAASVAAPSLKATPEGGGYRLEGTVAYCSGIPYSTYYMGQAMLPGTNSRGMPRVALFVAPRSAFTQLDDWGDTLGLKGTGSHSIRFDGAHVPAHYVLEDVNMIDVPVENGTPGLTLHGNPMYCGRALVIFTLSLACTLVGGAYNALEEYGNWALEKPTPLPPFGPRYRDPDFQRWYGAAFVKIQAAEAAMMRCAGLHMQACRLNASGERPYTWAEDARLAAIAREVMIQTWEAVDQHLLRTIGASAIKNGERFERLFRDLATAAAHRNTQLREDFFRQLGAIELGVPYPSPAGTYPPG